MMQSVRLAGSRDGDYCSIAYSRSCPKGKHRLRFSDVQKFGPVIRPHSSQSYDTISANCLKVESMMGPVKLLEGMHFTGPLLQRQSIADIRLSLNSTSSIIIMVLRQNYTYTSGYFYFFVHSHLIQICMI